jgi:Ran GTPase-activating protein (RanGAP) involved in mRNA processing and transport
VSASECQWLWSSASRVAQRDAVAAKSSCAQILVFNELRLFTHIISGTLLMARPTSAASMSAAFVLCVLLCACAPAKTFESTAPADDSDCALHITDETARDFFRSRAMMPVSTFDCDAVEHLGLGGGKFAGKDVRFFVPALLRMRALKTLDLSHMTLDADDMKTLAPVFTKLHALQRLSLNGNAIGLSGAAELASSVSSSSLEWLQLEHTGIGAEGLNMLTRLILRQNRTLTWLSLENCQLGTRGAAVVAAVIGELKQLHELNIARNGLGDSGCSEILAALSWNSVRKLWLGSNALTSTALQHFRGQHMQLLDLSANAFSTDCSAPLAAALHQMPALRILQLNGNDMLGDAGAEAVAAVFDALPSLSNVHMVGLRLSEPTRHKVDGKRRLLLLKLRFVGFFLCIHVVLPRDFLFLTRLSRDVPAQQSGLSAVGASLSNAT